MANYSDIEFIAGQLDYISRMNTLRIRSQDQATEQEQARSGEISLLARLDAIVASAVLKSGLVADLDAAGFTLSNLRDATAAKHPTTLSQVQAIAATGGNPADVPITDFNVGSATARQYLKISSDGLSVVGDSEYWISKTTTYTAVPGDKILASTAGGSWTLTLPSTPADGAQIKIADSAASFGADPLTIARNGATIVGLAENMTVSQNHARFTLVYLSATNDWRLGA